MISSHLFEIDSRSKARFYIEHSPAWHSGSRLLMASESHILSRENHIDIQIACDESECVKYVAL